jgi:hypothetical protein
VDATPATAAKRPSHAERRAPGGEPRIAGRVTDASGNPIAGAQVMILGTSVGTLSRPDGGYSLPVPGSPPGSADSLVVTATGLGFASGMHVLTAGAPAYRPVDFRLLPVAVSLDGLVASPIGVGAEVAEAGSAERSASWTRVTPGAARRLLGRAPPVVAGLRVLSMEAGRTGGMPAVRVSQALEDGTVLTLLVRRTRGVALRSAAPEEAVWDSIDAGTQRVVEIGDLVVVARAPVAEEGLRELLARLR